MVFIKAPCKIVLTKNKFNTRYLFGIIRTLVKKINTSNLKKVHGLQDSIQIISQNNNKGSFVIPKYNMNSYLNVKNAINALSKTDPNMSSANTFGSKNEVDPIKHFIGTYTGWGGLPNKYAMYDLRIPKKNDGKTEYQLTINEKIPVNEFWSVTVYDKDGYHIPNVVSNINNFYHKTK